MNEEENKKKNFIRERLKTIRSLREDLLVEIPPFPRVIYIELNAGCNHSCAFCGNSKMKRHGKNIDFNLLKKILIEAYELGARELGLYRCGEPLIYRQIETVISEAKSIGYEYIFITTNGALATPEKCRSLIEAGLNSIKFSVNAGSPSTYHELHGKDEFEIVVNNMQFWHQYRDQKNKSFKILGTCVITEKNFKELEQITGLFSKYTDNFEFYLAFTQYGYMLENSKNLIPDNIKKNLVDLSVNYPCTYPFIRFDVTQEGFYSACCLDFDNYLAIADLSKMSVSEAWKCPEIVSLRQKHIAGDASGTLCDSCIKKKDMEINPINFDLYNHTHTVEGKG
jgi:MoaA/NifB/PqqE/SkfB family radical SAM enzyme